MIISQKNIENYQFVSIVTTANASKYYFPDLPNLREVKLHSIVAYYRGVLPVDNNNNALVANAGFRNAYITLVSGNDEVVQSLDLGMLNPISTNAAVGLPNYIHGYMDFGGLVINFSKSYIQYTPSASFTIPAFGYSFGFGIIYSHINRNV